MTGKPKCESEAMGETWIQSSGSPHNTTEAERTAYRAERTQPMGWTCPQCGSKMAEHQWGWRCERPNCNTVLGDEWSGRITGQQPTTAYHCAGCNAETTRRVYMGEPYTYLAVCETCDRAVQQLKGAA